MRRVLTFSLFLLLPICALAADPPSVILITLDTVRADRMGFLGSKLGLTPQLDSLASESVVFPQAYSQAPLTPVSHATILTGTYPHFHGVRDFGSRLPDSVPYLPSLFRAQGYRTAAFVSSIILDPQNGLASGFERGFDVFDAGFHRVKHGERRNPTMQRRGEVTVQRALDWLEKNHDKPVFLWIHIWDAHDPYDPPEPFKTRYAKTPYNGCVAYVDSAVGKLLAGLKSRGVYRGAVVAVMSDHGESLGEHGENTHGVFLYDSTIRVPLLIKLPEGKFAGENVSQRASLVDVAPTLLAAAMAPQADAMQGQSLLSLISKKDAGIRPSFSEAEYGQRAFGWSPLEALRSGNSLFVKAPQPELYNDSLDPGQRNNVIERNKLTAVRLASELDRISKQAGANAPKAAQTSLDPQSAEKLRAMGYMASTGTAGANSGVDPKMHIQVANDLHDADLRIEDGKELSAVPLLERVVASDPQIPHAQYFLGVAYKQLHQYDQAILHLNNAIRLAPDSMMGHYEIALALYETGDLITAASHLEILVESRPDWSDARYSLASIYARTERPEEAAKNLLVVLQGEPDHYRANLLLGRMLFLNGTFAEALPYLEKAAAVQTDSVEAHSFLADEYEKLGRADDAARERAEAARLKSSPR
jgi:arylsulfatase A-like enzyme/tetratricopeptide (TPR) repeat protein